jgi:hypothetical protein
MSYVTSSAPLAYNACILDDFMLSACSRFMTFNASMSKDKPGEINKDLASGTNEAITNISTIIQIVRPDVLLINEFDFQPKLENVKLFQDKYLSVAHTPAVGTTTQPIRCAHMSTCIDWTISNVASGLLMKLACRHSIIARCAAAVLHVQHDRTRDH